MHRANLADLTQPSGPILNNVPGREPLNCIKMRRVILPETLDFDFSEVRRSIHHACKGKRQTLHL